MHMIYCARMLRLIRCYHTEFLLVQVRYKEIKLCSAVILQTDDVTTLFVMLMSLLVVVKQKFELVKVVQRTLECESGFREGTTLQRPSLAFHSTHAYLICHAKTLAYATTFCDELDMRQRTQSARKKSDKISVNKLQHAWHGFTRE